MFMKNLTKISAVFAVAFLLGSFSSAADEPVRSGSTAKTEQPVSTSAISNTTPEQDTNEATAGGLEATKADFMKFFSKYRLMNGTKIIDTKIADATTAQEKYLSNWSTCVGSQKVAAYACLSNLSPSIQDGVAAVNTLAAAAGASSVNDSCSTFGKAMGVAQAALTAYTAGCGAAKGHCSWYCSDAKSALSDFKKALSGPYACKNPSEAASCQAFQNEYADLRATLLKLAEQELTPKNIKSIAGKTEVCTSKYAQLALSAATGIYGIVNALKQGKSCDEASNADGSTSTATSETCAIEANANLPECICLKNPMLEGCGSVAAKSSMSSTGSGLSALAATGSSTGTDGLSAADLATGSSTSTAARDPSSSSSSGAGVPTGGGASLGGGSGFGSGSGTGGDDKSGHKALDTNILAGSGGGGGGGGMWGGGDSSDKSGLRSYLPGGAKDPTKLGGQLNNTSKEVTGQGGKSNWEKVRDRYQDNKSSLLNN
jgi:hypothetical protein